ncbi:MAG: hypothetical protein V2I97_17945 [Desulfococcaceae bacterium]|jgi:hypothetical protein|nr:hypothetical protein [Desulfococcaceae bacterium]
MDKKKDIRNFLKAIRRALPDAAAKTDEIMRGRGFDSDEEPEYIWVEAFADVTNMFIRQRNQAELRKEFLFFSNQLDRGSQTVKNCIDVSYAENLMWDLTSEDRKWVWSQIPENLKKCYTAMWGNPDF